MAISNSIWPCVAGDFIKYQLFKTVCRSMLAEAEIRGLIARTDTPDHSPRRLWPQNGRMRHKDVPQEIDTLSPGTYMDFVGVKFHLKAVLQEQIDSFRKMLSFDV